MKRKAKLIAASAGCLSILTVLFLTQRSLAYEAAKNEGVYKDLRIPEIQNEPLAGINSDFKVDESEFETHLPIAVLTIDGELPDYKKVSSDEVTFNGTDPYTTGTLRVISTEDGVNTLQDLPHATSEIRIKKRGATSYGFSKNQYLMKTVNEQEKNEVDLLGMGKSDTWILNGSLADKSMLRNYLAYRISSKVGGGNFSPDSQFCEVILQDDSGFHYQGVYLMMESIEQNENRVDISDYKKKERYTSYIVRRDRYRSDNEMLDTYARINGLSDQWIGLKYPNPNKITDTARKYVESDFSLIEKCLYSDDVNHFSAYPKYIDVDSFVDYFLINEFFGNYDAGLHSTYMYKDNGGLLEMGPVWDFDQAMNNSFLTEAEPETLAFYERPFFSQLARDSEFLRQLKTRYAELRRTILSEESIDSEIDQIVQYLSDPMQREWNRWEENYMDETGEIKGSYQLNDYEFGEFTVSRFNDSYEHEIYNIKTYLKVHGDVIQTEITKLMDSATFDTKKDMNQEVIFLMVLALLMTPALLVNRRG